MKMLKKASVCLMAITAGALTVSALVSTEARAGLLDWAMTANWTTRESIAYKVEAYGFDFRVYEWTPVGNEDMSCVTGFSEVGSIGLQCFPAGN